MTKSTLNTFKKAVRESIDSAFDDSFSAITKLLRRDLHARLDGFGKAKLQVIEGNSGDEWWSENLEDLVTEFIKDMDGASGREEAKWCNNVADDLVKQAVRIRKHANKILNEN